MLLQARKVSLLRTGGKTIEAQGCIKLNEHGAAVLFLRDSRASVTVATSKFDKDTGCDFEVGFRPNRTEATFEKNNRLTSPVSCSKRLLNRLSWSADSCCKPREDYTNYNKETDYAVEPGKTYNHWMKDHRQNILQRWNEVWSWLVKNEKYLAATNHCYYYGTQHFQTRYLNEVSYYHYHQLL